MGSAGTKHTSTKANPIIIIIIRRRRRFHSVVIDRYIYHYSIHCSTTPCYVFRKKTKLLLQFSRAFSVCQILVSTVQSTKFS
jgi:hypothetical protein